MRGAGAATAACSVIFWGFWWTRPFWEKTFLRYLRIFLARTSILKAISRYDLPSFTINPKTDHSCYLPDRLTDAKAGKSTQNVIEVSNTDCAAARSAGIRIAALQERWTRRADVRNTGY